MCTGLQLIAADGTAVNGRTAEFGIDLDLDVLYVPADTEYTSPLASGPGLTFTSKYAVVGASCFGADSVLDGINDQGLAAGGFYFPGFADYAPATPENIAIGLAPPDLGHWILSTCASLDEVRQVIGTVRLVDGPVASWHGIVPPFHYAVYDRTGASIVIEPRGGELVVSDNPIGVLTNSPQFEFHLLNLRQYTNIRTATADSSTVAGTPVTAFGMGTGGIGVPGDFTPPSRFVRAALFSANHATPATATDAVQEVFHLLNNFDIPKGFVTEVSGDQVAADWTLGTVVRDSGAGLYCYRSYGDQTIRSVSLPALVAASAPLGRIPVGPAVGSFTPVVDATAGLLAPSPPL